MVNAGMAHLDLGIGSDPTTRPFGPTSKDLHSRGHFTTTAAPIS
jgi:hypothetical protein